MKEKDIEQVAEFIVTALKNTENETMLKEVQSKVNVFARTFPLFKN